MSESKTPEEKPEQLSGHEAPIIYAAVIQATRSSNDFTLIFGRHIPVSGGSNTFSEKSALIPVPVGVLQMSPQTAKDLYLLMQDHIREYEEQYGLITTAYSQSQEKTGE